LTEPLDYEKIKDVIVWRCISMKVVSGGMSWFPHSEYLYDDYVLATSLGDYLMEITNRGDATKITLHREGAFHKVLGSEHKQRSGTVSINKQKSITKLDKFGLVDEKREIRVIME
jgi:hypothetical protein